MVNKLEKGQKYLVSKQHFVFPVCKTVFLSKDALVHPVIPELKVIGVLYFCIVIENRRDGVNLK